MIIQNGQSLGFLFFAIRGTRLDGNRFIPKAIAKGAAAVVSALAPVQSVAMPWIQVDDEREAMARIAANFYGHPTENLHLIGVTGTNGKTTTTYIIESILKADNKPAAVFGTIEYRGPGFAAPGVLRVDLAPGVSARTELEIYLRVWKVLYPEASVHMDNDDEGEAPAA